MADAHDLAAFMMAECPHPAEDVEVFLVPISIDEAAFIIRKNGVVVEEGRGSRATIKTLTDKHETRQ